MSTNDIFSIVVAVLFLVMGTYFNYRFNQIGKDNDWSSVKNKR